MKDSCDCCAGLHEITPQPTANRPGLTRLAYRVGTHSTFFETMLARLSAHSLEIVEEASGATVEAATAEPESQTLRPLRGLTMRSIDDPAIALLDAWAIVADVLTFYQERIANEGYLRTATERRSILELARLVGYKLRPGVAASVYLAFDMVTGSRGDIPKGTRAQSVPGPGEQMQAFETTERLEARDEWNQLQVRLKQPQHIALNNTNREYDVQLISTVYFKGTATNLRTNDGLLFVFDTKPGQQVFRHVLEVEAQPAENREDDRTQVTLRPLPFSAVVKTSGGANSDVALDRTRVEVTRHLDVRAFGLAPRNVAVARVTRVLKKLNAELAPATTDEQLAAMLDSETLPTLEQEQEAAHAGNSAKLAAWLDSIVEGLKVSTTTLTAPSSGAENESTSKTVASFAPEGIKITEVEDRSPLSGLGDLLGTDALAKPASQPPANALRLDRTPQSLFTPPVEVTKRPPPGNDKQIVAVSDLGAQILGVFNPLLREPLYAAWRNAQVTDAPPLQTVHTFRVKAGVFGNISQPDPHINRDGTVDSYSEWTITVEPSNPPPPSEVPSVPILAEAAAGIPKGAPVTMRANVLPLDAVYDQIKPLSWVALFKPGAVTPVIAQVESVETVGRAAFGLSAKITQLTLDVDWLGPNDTFEVIRKTSVYAQSERLELSDAPIEEPVCDTNIELSSLYDGLKAGRWLIFAGERNDIAGVPVSELVMLAGVTQYVKKISNGMDSADNDVFIDLPNDKTHTFLQLSAPLAYCYRRESLKIYGNVAPATHGETREEVLGSGDSSQALQSFALKQNPLTFVSAPTPAGAASTLQVRVNDVLWHEADNFAGLGPNDHNYLTKTDDEDMTVITFGNGKQGARLPKGPDNIRAVYRTGLGKPGNVKVGQISLLATQPLGVKTVINPMAATGGADRESRDAARRNAPLAVTALDRLVSVGDYADFARTFAGIAKAAAARLSDGRRQLVHLTIAGADDIPIATNSDLYRNLVQALADFGDPHQAFRVDIRELVLLFISAKVRLLPDYLWESVEPKIRDRLLDVFSFDNRELGQDVLLSEVMAAAQSVAGVDYIDVDTFLGIPEKIIDPQSDELRARSPEEIAAAVQTQIGQPPPTRITVSLSSDSLTTIRPAQIAYLSADVSDTLILTEIPQ